MYKIAMLYFHKLGTSLVAGGGNCTRASSLTNGSVVYRAALTCRLFMLFPGGERSCTALCSALLLLLGFGCRVPRWVV